MSATSANPSDRGFVVARTLADWLRERFGDRIVDVVVFGSVARGEADEDSDLDVLVLVNEPLTWDEQNEVWEYSYDLDLANGTVTQWFAETVEHWGIPAVRGSGLHKAVESEGVAV